MPDLKFACPACQQHIQAEPAYAGLQIACPACRASILVPGTPVAVAPPPPALALASAPSIAYTAPPPTPRGSAVQSVRPPVRPARVPAGAAPWYKTPYPYLLVLFGILGWLYYLGQSNPGAKLALVSVAALYSLTIHIVVTIAAFRESVGTGFLTLCVPFYAIYFVFKISESNLLQLLYTTAFVINLILRFTDK